MGFVTDFLRRAEEILEVAIGAPHDVEQETAIVIDRQGGIRMLDAAGWSLSGLMAEFGAAAVYRMKKSRGSVRVEGWDGMQRCELQRPTAGPVLPALPGWGQPRMLQAIAPLVA